MALESANTTASEGETQTFRRVLGASSVSMLGSHVTTIAYPLLVLRLTGSPVTAGFIVFAATAPSIAVYIPAGALVDRWSPRRAMLFSEVGRGVAIASVAATLAIGKPIVALLMAVAVIEGVLEVVSGLAERRYVGSLVRPDQVPSTLVQIEARTHVVLVAGRPLGGLLFGLGPIFPFLADAASFVYSAAVLTGIKDKDNRSTRETEESPGRLIHRNSLASDIRQGLDWMFRDKFAPMAIMVFSLGTLIFQALIMVFISDAHSRGLPTLAIGMVLAASGVGGALGSLVAPRLLPRAGLFWIRIQTCVWTVGFACLVLFAWRQFFYTAIIMAVLGLTGALGNIALDTHLMWKADKEMLARVTSVGRLATFGACAIGPVIGGVLVQAFGVQDAMFCLFFLSPVLLVLAVLAPAPSATESSNSEESVA